MGETGREMVISEDLGEIIIVIEEESQARWNTSLKYVSTLGEKIDSLMIFTD